MRGRRGHLLNLGIIDFQAGKDFLTNAQGPLDSQNTRHTWFKCFAARSAAPWSPDKLFSPARSEPSSSSHSSRLLRMPWKRDALSWHQCFNQTVTSSPRSFVEWGLRSPGRHRTPDRTGTIPRSPPFPEKTDEQQGNRVSRGGVDGKELVLLAEQRHASFLVRKKRDASKSSP